MIHGAVRKNKQSPEGIHTQALGARIGFWPCLRAPFVQVSIGPYVVSGWVGRASKHVP